MKKKSFSTLIASLNLTIFTFFLLPETTSCVDPQYEACVPQNCGDQSISYPFWIDAKQNSYCGYPGFKLICQNGYPILQTRGNDYLVQKIFYNNQSLRISNTAVLNLESVCFPPIRNVSLEEDKFEIGSDVSKLYLLSDCSTPLPEKLLDYKIGCAAENGNDWGLAMFDNEGNLSYALDVCKTEVLAPVELYADDGIEDYLEVLRRGIVLKWKAGDCSRCGESGGRCGFDASSYHFNCFCPDRAHRVKCSPIGVTPEESCL